MRKYVGSDDKINAPVAGFISGLSVGFESKSRKALFTILVVSRCIDSILNFLQEEGYISTNKNMRYFLMFCVSSTFIVFLHVVRPELVHAGHLKFQRKWSMLTHNDRVVLESEEKLWKGNYPFY